MKTPWDRIRGLLSSASDAAAGTLERVMEGLRTLVVGDPETRRRVAFSVAMIALSAKMAKADGVVTVDEVAAFERIFEVPADERRNVARVYDLAKGDVAGFEGYAMQLAGLCEDGRAGCVVLEDILEGLFHIAKADGVLHEAEVAFLARVAEIFGLSADRFDAIVARHAVAGEGDPYAALGLQPGTDPDAVRRRYRKLVSEHHPDRAIARGMPPEFVAIANERLVTFNEAYERIRAMEAA